jgi:hypothetical protein
LFLLAMKEAHKAWAHTPMLARVLDSQARTVCDTLALESGMAIAEMLSDMAGPAITSYSVRSSLDADKAQQLSSLVLQMCMPSCVVRRDQGGATSHTARALALCEASVACLVAWIETGRSQGAPQLNEVDALIGGEAAIRLSLVATAAPVLAHCEIVVRALEEGYPFAPPVRR